MQVQQRQEVMRLLSTLTPEQREQLSRLPTTAQVHARFSLVWPEILRLCMLPGRQMHSHDKAAYYNV